MSRLSAWRQVAGCCCLLALGTMRCARSAIQAEAESRYVTFRGAGDASAAVALDGTTFVMADDEDNVLRVYDLNSPDRPAATCDLNSFLRTAPGDSEVDIEAAGVIGSRIYWVASHDTNKSGKIRSGRDYFFATEAVREGGGWSLQPVGIPCRTLLHSLVVSPLMKDVNLYVADSDSVEADHDAPKAERKKISIEGMCSSLDGTRLYLGFRRPAIDIEGGPRLRALVVPLENPAEVVESGAAPVFGEPLLWDLDERVIRGMEDSPADDAVFVIGGREQGPDAFALYRWNGDANQPPVLVTLLDTDRHQLSPETLVTSAGSQRILVISDDGELMIPVGDAGSDEAGGYARNKRLTDPRLKRFRALWVAYDRADLVEDTGWGTTRPSTHR